MGLRWPSFIWQKKTTEEDALRQNIIARLKAKSATRTTEQDEWDPDSVEEWNPADEARQAKRLKSWRSLQEQRLGERNHKVTDSPSEFRPYQNPRQKLQQPQRDPR